MADYFEQVVFENAIPAEDLSDIEKFILTRMFDHHFDAIGLNLFTNEAIMQSVEVDRAELEEALLASAGTPGVATAFVAEALDMESGQSFDLDVSGLNWTDMLQNIVARSQTLTHIGIIIAYTASKMRADGFGGAAILITADQTRQIDTFCALHNFKVEAGILPPAAAA